MWLSDKELGLRYILSCHNKLGSYRDGLNRSNITHGTNIGLFLFLWPPKTP